MVTESSFPSVEIPNVDLYGFMFERKDRKFPDDQIIYRSCSNPKRSYTWQSVREAADAFGKGLRNQWDWAKNDVLCIYAPNDVDFAAIVYGTLYAGGIVTPANPAYSANELEFQLRNSEAKALVTTKQFLDTAQKACQKAGIPSDRIILLGEERDESHKFKRWTNIRATSGAVRYRRRKMDPDQDLAFLAYSSGTTGLPKGVMLSHRNIIADVLLINGAVGNWYKGGEDKILGVLPFFHIYGLTGLIHQPLHRGLEVVVMPAFNMEVRSKMYHCVRSKR